MVKNSNLKIKANSGYLRGMLMGAILAVGANAWIYVLQGYKRREDEEKLLVETVKQTLLNSGNSTVTSDEKLERCSAILKYGVPEDGRMVRYYTNHALVYNQQMRTPVWVAEHLTKENLQGETTRKFAHFMPDPAVDADFTAVNSDYWKSGWSRGHMAPAGDNKMNLEAMQDSFYLSNVVPQNYENNAGFWNRLEMFCRDLTKKYSNVYIISGPAMIPDEDEDGKKYVKYQVIGENDVAVPTHLFKLVIVEDKHGKTKAVSAFVVPNKPIGFEHHLKEFEVDLPALEKILGVKLVKYLERDRVESLCKVDGCKLIGKKEFELYFIGRKLESANTRERVEKVWSELEEKKLKPDRYLKKLYKKKLEELEEVRERAKGS